MVWCGRCWAIQGTQDCIRGMWCRGKMVKVCGILLYSFVFWVDEEKPDHPTRAVYYRKAVG